MYQKTMVFEGEFMTTKRLRKIENICDKIEVEYLITEVSGLNVDGESKQLLMIEITADSAWLLSEAFMHIGAYLGPDIHMQIYMKETFITDIAVQENCKPEDVKVL